MLDLPTQNDTSDIPLLNLKIKEKPNKKQSTKWKEQPTDGIKPEGEN